MQSRVLGQTGLKVSPLGLGAGPLGNAELPESDAEKLLNTALDLGLTFIDTARAYGLSEERIGRHLSHRRTEFIISTKGGYGVDGIPDWTPEAVTLGINRALRELRTDHIDVFHLHSCPLSVLSQERILAALELAVSEGKIGVAAYSGESEPLGWAIGSGQFGVIQSSISLIDQRGLGAMVPLAEERGMGVIAKRPLGNAVWRFQEPPTQSDLRSYWDRWQVLAPSLEALRGGLDWSELALRFATFAPGVSTAIVGSTSVNHLRSNVLAAERGPLPEDQQAEIRRRFEARDQSWDGLI
jgi:aryl-alcohol dehydrogenase-like predicted oxidoreductase